MIRRKVMSDELYYRGSSTYETAVRNQLSRLQNSNVMLRNSIRDMEYGIRSDIRQSTYAIVASQQMLAQTFQHGFSSVNNTLEIGFDRMSARMADIADSIDSMSDKICSKLDEIHDIVNNPLLTQSRELYRRALVNFEKGYYEEALEDIKAAVEKNKTDFISWNLLGQIYLFGAGKFSNVINLDEAENAFFNAAKYIDADIGRSKEANKLASEIYYYLGYTRLVKSNDMLVESKVDESNKKLIEAESASGRAYQISKENILAGYEQAKELHFLGKDDEALKIIKAIITAEPTLALKASNDKNFESMWNKIDALIEQLRDEFAEKTREKCREYRMVVETEIKNLKAKIERISYPPVDAVNEINSYYKVQKGNFVQQIQSRSKKISYSEDERKKVEKLGYTELLNNKLLQKLIIFNTNPAFDKDLCVVPVETAIETGLSGKESLQKLLDDLTTKIQNFLDESVIGNDYLSVKKTYEKLVAVDIRSYLKDVTKPLETKIEDAPKNLKYLKIYLRFFALTGRSSLYPSEPPTPPKEEKNNKVWAVVCAIVAIAALIPAALFILNERVIIGFLILVASALFGMGALGVATRLTKGAARFFVRMYVVAETLFTVGLFVKGHWVLGLLAGFLALTGFISWNGEKKEKTNSAE